MSSGTPMDEWFVFGGAGGGGAGGDGGIDLTPPIVDCSGAKSMLLPPDHNLVNVGLNADVSDESDSNPIVNVKVFGDEDDEEPTGDGTHSPDAKDIALKTLRLRAERKGNADGRVYLIIVTATDTAGNKGFDCCTVVVSRNQSQAAIKSVNEQAAAAEAFCHAHDGAAPPGYFVIGDGPVIGPRQ